MSDWDDRRDRDRLIDKLPRETGYVTLRGTERRMFEASEAIARGDNCIECGATWDHEEHYMKHRDNCWYIWQLQEPDVAQIRMDDIAADRREAIDTAMLAHREANPPEVSEERVLTYTRTYRMVTTLTDEQIIDYANEYLHSIKSHDMHADSLVDAVEPLAELYDKYGNDKDNKVQVELHSTHVEESDPGLF